MRTTIDLPDGLYRQLKARAALEGRPVKDLLHALLQRALRDEVPGAPVPQRPRRSAPPTLSTGQALPLRDPSNAALFDLLDERR
jgi:hypothetical protein